MKVILGEVEEYSLEEYLKYRTLRNVKVYVDGVYMKDCYGFDTDKGEAYIHVTDRKGNILANNDVRKAIIHGNVTVEIDDDSVPINYEYEMPHVLVEEKKRPVEPFQINIKIVQTFEGEVTEHDLKDVEDAVRVSIEKIARMLESKGTPLST